MISKFTATQLYFLNEIMRIMDKMCKATDDCDAGCPVYGNRRLCEFLHSNSHNKYMSAEEIHACEIGFRECIANYLMKEDEND